MNLDLSCLQLKYGKDRELVADIEVFEKKIGLKLPTDFVRYLQHMNGGVSVEDLFFRRINENVLIKNFISYTGLKIDNGLYWEYEIFQEEMEESDLLPFAFDIGSQPICIALAPDDSVGTIVSIWEVEDEVGGYSVVKIADSFGDFVESICVGPRS